MSEAPMLTQQRHRDLLHKSIESLKIYLKSIENNKLSDQPDFALSAEELRIAGKWMGQLTGTISSEDILDVIFRDFCIGK